nr:hypothetical protein [Tanacetum cinerariifolium]
MWGDSLVRAATTASLDAQQDSSNIAKTQSKLTLNEPTPHEEGSGSGSGCQETIGGAMAQIRSEGAPIQFIDPPLSTGHTVRSGEDMMEHEIELTDLIPQTPHDSPLSGGYTPRSDEGSMTLKELTDLCTTLSNKVLDLEKDKIAQAKEIASLKKRVTKLEQRQSLRISGFHPFRAGMNFDLDKDFDIEMIIKDKGNGEKRGSTKETFSTAMPDISVSRPEKAKEKGIAFKYVDDSARPIRSITTLQPLLIIDLKDKGKGILQEPEPMKKTKKKDHNQIERDAEVALKIQADLDEEAGTERERQEEASKAALAEMYDEKLLAKERAEAIRSKLPTKTQLRNLMMIYLKHTGSEEDEKRIGSRKKRAAGSSLKHKSPKKQKVNDQESKDSDKELRKCLKVVLDDNKAIDYETLDVKSLIVDFFDRQDVMDLHNIIMERFPTNDQEGYDLILWGDLKTLVESSKDDEIWRNQ